MIESNKIKEFKGEYGFLSNFYTGDGQDIEYGRYHFNCVEVPFQASKCTDLRDISKFCGLTPSEAKKLGRRIQLRPDWEEVKIKVMKWFLIQKFKTPELRQLLLNTGDAYLEEGNWWKDQFWGVDINTGIGENHLGILLMEVREEIKNENLLYNN